MKSDKKTSHDSITNLLLEQFFFFKIKSPFIGQVSPCCLSHRIIWIKKMSLTHGKRREMKNLINFLSWSVPFVFVMTRIYKLIALMWIKMDCHDNHLPNSCLKSFFFNCSLSLSDVLKQPVKVQVFDHTSSSEFIDKIFWTWTELNC